MAPGSRGLLSNDYTVAWVSTTPKEHTIACAVLDQVHPVPADIGDNDDVYTFGRIGEHNVVMVCCALARAGRTPAAVLVTEMGRLFPNLRFVLSVGVAGGAPTNETDIRLGDLVISLPSNDEEQSGVVNYRFEPITYLSTCQRREGSIASSEMLVDAVNRLKDVWNDQGDHPHPMINDMFEQNIPVPVGYQKLLKHADVLYKSTYLHSEDDKCCGRANDVDEVAIVDRVERSNGKGSAMTYYGTIAFTNIPVQDAALRDRLAYEDKILCFDMASTEPTSSDLACMIVRGIASYCDAHHVHDLWSKYAAMTAAVYARQLLDAIQPIAIDQNITAGVTPVGNADVLEILRFKGMGDKAESSMPEALFFHEWIWLTNFYTWLLQRDDAFWILGKPGSGKSSLMSYLAHNRHTLETLCSSDPNFRVVYFHFDHRARKGLPNNIYGMYRTILYQLADRNVLVKRRLTALSNTGRLRLNSEQQLLTALCEALDVCGQKLCIFLDGLDEYEGGMIELICTIKAIVNRVPAKFCLASRPDGSTTDDARPWFTITMQEFNEASMEQYARRKTLQKSATNPAIVNRLDKSVLQQLIVKADGVLLWFRRAVDEIIERFETDQSDTEMIESVEQMPSGLDAVYERSLNSIAPDRVAEAALILYLIANLNSVSQWTEEGIADSMEFTTSDLDHLWGTYNFVLDQLGHTIDIRPALNCNELRISVERLLGGVVEFHSLDSKQTATILDLGGGTGLGVGLIHEDFPIFLLKTGWIDRHLPPQVKEHFGDDFWLGFSSKLIEQAAKESVIRPEIMAKAVQELSFVLDADQPFKMSIKESLSYTARSTQFFVKNPFSLLVALHGQFCPTIQDLWISQLCVYLAPDVAFPEGWKTRHVVFRTAFFIFLDAAAKFESAGHSSFPIIAKAMQSYLNPIIGYCLFVSQRKLTIDEHLRATHMDDRLRPISDVYLAIVGKLTLYFRDRLSDDEFSLSDYQRNFLYRVLLSSPDTDEGPSVPTTANFITTLTILGRPPQNQDVCFLLKNTQCWKTAAEFALALKDSTAPELQRESICGDCCEIQGHKVGTLFHWAQVTCSRDCRCEDESTPSPAEYGRVIDVLVALGADIHQPCYPGGTVLSALLDGSIRPRRGRKPQDRQAKFLALIEKGLVYEAIPEKENLLRAATALYRKGYTSPSDRNEVDLIIAYLRFHEIFGVWPQDSSAAEEMRQSAVDRWSGHTVGSKTKHATDIESQRRTEWTEREPRYSNAGADGIELRDLSSGDTEQTELYDGPSTIRERTRPKSGIESITDITDTVGDFFETATADASSTINKWRRSFTTNLKKKTS